MNDTEKQLKKQAEDIHRLERAMDTLLRHNKKLEDEIRRLKTSTARLTHSVDTLNYAIRKGQ